MLELFDKNCHYWLQFEEAQWNPDWKNNDIKCHDVVSVQIKNTIEVPEEDKVPEETDFIMSVKDAKYLHAWLTVFLKDKV